MDIAQLIAVITQLGLAAGAFRLATALKLRVDDHEKRISSVEGRPSAEWSR